MSQLGFRRILLPPAISEAMAPERIANLVSVRAMWVGLALGLDLALFAILRHASGLRPAVVRLFAEINVSLMAIDLALTLVALRKPWRFYRLILRACILCEVLAATVWIQMTGTISTYFLIVGYLLVLLYRLLFDYYTGLTCLVAMAVMHCGAFGLEELGLLRPASLFVAEPQGIYEVPLFRVAAMLSLVVGYAVTFLALNFFVTTLRSKEAALKTAQLDLARVVDETQNHGRLCGQVLAGSYQVQELIGRGGMAEVYQARRISDGRPVAIKVLHLHLHEQVEMRERFRREAMMVSRIPAAHVPELLELGATPEGHLYIAMEYLRGEDLAAVLRRRERIGLAEVVPLVEQIAGALEAAHAAGVVHRDLKPQNVFLVDAAGAAGQHVRLLDFGISRLQEGDGLTLTTELLGTAGYMAPEQARGASSDIGPHTDVFALGSIIYRVLTGICPFPSRSTAAAVYETLNLHPAPPSRFLRELPQDVDHVLTLALAKQVVDRYAHPSLLAADLRRAARAELDEATRERARALAPPVDSPHTRKIHPPIAPYPPALPTPNRRNEDRETRRRRR